MADFKTPNLCGANPELNNALSKIDDLIGNIDSKISSAASEAAAAIETGLADVKAGLDGLAIDLPEIPDVNFQSELTGLINDIDKTTIQGLATFNSKLAQLELDFGNTLKEKGLTLDSLISDATTKLSSGGNLCELAPNIEIPSGSSGTGITIQEIEERGTGSSVTLTQTPKEILSVTGKTTTQSFFTNIQYKQNGKVIVPSADGTYSDIKVLYTVSLIKEKPVEAKQADTSPDAEEVSIVTTNASAVDTKTFSSFNGLLAKIKTKSVLGLATEKETSDLNSALASINSPTLKSKMDADFAKANAFLSGKGPGTLSGEISATLNPPLGENGKVVPIKVTTPITASTVTKEKLTKINPTTNRKETVEVKKTVKAPLSSVGFTNRKVEITEEFYTSSLPSGSIETDGFKLIEKGNDLNLKHTPVSIVEINAREYLDADNYNQFIFLKGQLRGSGVNNIIPALVPPKNINLIQKSFADGYVTKINAVIITYEYLEKLDPSVKG